MPDASSDAGGNFRRSGKLTEGNEAIEGWRRASRSAKSKRR
jgi:hypothetical protein